MSVQKPATYVNKLPSLKPPIPTSNKTVPKIQATTQSIATQSIATQPIENNLKSSTKLETPATTVRKILEKSVEKSPPTSPNISNKLYIDSATSAYTHFMKICATMITAGAVAAGFHPLIGVLIISIGLALCFLGTITFHIATKGRKEEERDQKLLAFPATSSDTQPEKTKTLSPAEKKEQRMQARLDARI